MDALNLLASWAAIFDPVGDSSRGRRSLHAADDPHDDTRIINHGTMVLPRLDSSGPRIQVSKKVALEPVTKEVTTAPGKGRRSTTYPDTEIPLNCGNQT
jgi:hypothetical protein